MPEASGVAAGVRVHSDEIDDEFEGGGIVVSGIPRLVESVAV
jgi:hypothetical protein